MTEALPKTALELRSLVTDNGTLELSLHEVAVPTPAQDEVVVRVEASPINPSDLGLLIPSTADMSAATVVGTPDRPVVTAPLRDGALAGLAARVGISLPVGNEGAGTVVAAGESAQAQALLGKTVGIAGGAMYAQYRVVKAEACLVLPEGASAKEGASSFVNPLTALGMLETMRREGHSALVHTAAASNLGQMLVKACLADGVPLVNIVRKAEQEDILRGLGAVHVCNSSSPSFETDLVEALKATSATLAFDATGGGTLASQILNGMERAANATAAQYSRYGSSVHKQVYIYGSLDTGPTVLTRNFGMAWGVGGWLLTPFLAGAGPETIARLRARVAAELTTTFASTYTQEVSLAGMLQPEAFNSYLQKATGEKYLVTPQA
ncbi:zinc-binding dehydrogenase [Mycolicibacterium fortuitum]|uniref:Quinone reductase, Qor n=1 Tax=Mycolicibacterium fortuitum subsp. fortuitum DSM 46621 = ATCC 6841 = JCM 6387 TaxID=1214102 RepID=K0UYR6_MYCFO|nr:zinc-binding dehydrogenase [Mycolicibacterium fortuitum]AIY48034.1 putative NADH oxidoreductase [Mycobacterium sp. VKM Ac-1817D]CRL74097.1 quinone reductase, Qor [Mycolicibacter nonchromogenicus]EJZ11891.1 quinone reductase, Qor [Mycolicibacterium fortuitum subsp. fortuitum DSM 46621 = ATCC 6841 = JCM 6387]WEV31647.1 zinc-binding dehydrogenase [Mycolicibacterium fortuitum]CRL58232.1 quinone reductase, Qor [Mycolicibacterium fortuitum subsp. fortuitum DSM 46621 = ATCC 6841 = JCM 6387]